MHAWAFLPEDEEKTSDDKNLTKFKRTQKQKQRKQRKQQQHR
jgi:hypothetical protein